MVRFSFKDKMIRYIPLETVAIFFSSEHLSKIGYLLGVCRGLFYLHRLMSCKERKPTITK